MVPAPPPYRRPGDRAPAFGYGGSRRVGRPHRASLPDGPRYLTGQTRGAIGYSASPTASKPSRHERKVWIRMILPSRTTL